MPHNTTPIGVCPKTCPDSFDKQLSLSLDAAHDELERLSCQHDLRAWWRRFCLKRQLRKMEARIPQ